MTPKCSVRLLVAAGVIALAATSCSSHDATTGQRTSHPPSVSYYAPGVPYVLNGTLFVDHTARSGNWISSETVGAYTAVTGLDPKRDSFTLMIMRNGVEVHVEHDYFEGAATFSPNGTKLAWFRSGKRDVATLVIWDLPRSREFARRSIPFTPIPGSGLQVGLEVENDGTAYYDLQNKSWSWKPGSAPVRAAQHNETMRTPTGFSGVTALVSLSPDHLWGAWEDTAKGTLVVQKPGDPSSRFAMKHPAATDPSSLVDWRSPTLAEIRIAGLTNDGLPKQILCDIVSRTCTVSH